MAYGAVGDTIADDTIPVQAVFTAAAAVHGTVDLGNYRYKTTAPIILPSGITVKGTGSQGYDAGGKGGLANNTSDVFQFGTGGTSGTVYSVTFENVTIGASAGHIFNMGPAGGLGYSNFKGCSFNQSGTGYSIFYCPTNANYISNFVGANTYMYMNPAATVPAIYLVCNGNNIGTNIWQNCVFESGHSTTVPFVHIESAASGSYSNSNIFRDIQCEELDAGVISLLGCTYSIIENVQCYDTTTFTGPLFYIGKGGGSPGLNSFQNTIRNSGSIGGSFAAGAYHVQAASTTGSLLLDGVGGESGAAVLNIRTATTTIINPPGSGAGVTSPSLSASGLGNATAGARLVGGTASGAPTSGTFTVGDVNVDQTGVLWVCTIAGAPGTWTQVGAGSGYASANDPLKLGLTQTFLPGIASAAYSVGPNVGYFMKLLSGGYAISKIGIAINVSSGNICVAAYQNSGSGTSSGPNTQYQTSGSVPCPAQGYSLVALGGSCTPSLGDWLGVGCDNGTATVYGQSVNYVGNAYMMQGSSCSVSGLTGAVLPSPAGTITWTGSRMLFMRGAA